MKSKSVFGENLKQLRKSRRLTREEVARHLGINKNTLAGYESIGREPSFDLLVKIADYFAVSVDELLRSKENNNSEEAEGKVQGVTIKRNGNQVLMSLPDFRLYYLSGMLFNTLVEWVEDTKKPQEFLLKPAKDYPVELVRIKKDDNAADHKEE